MSFKLALQTVEKEVSNIRKSYTDYISDGRCSDWGEYTSHVAAIAALDRVTQTLEDILANRDTVD